jgi:GMP synthase (glutamine-hydrolysing)
MLRPLEDYYMLAHPTIKLLIVEGNTDAMNEEILAQGGRAYSEIYATVLKAIDPTVETATLRVNEADITELWSGDGPASFDGVVWTGSILNIYNDGADVSRQLELFRNLFNAGIPIFGSCWGMQVMAAALGGKVRRNPLGREIGIARNVQLTDAGLHHPMFAGKSRVFDSIATHVDEVEILPEGATLLASNSACSVQAIAIDDGARSFWGVQYHPEFDLDTLAFCIKRNATALVEEGFFETQAEADAITSSLRKIHRQPGSLLARQSVYGVTETVVEDAVRRLEIANWVQSVARTRAKTRRDQTAPSLPVSVA